MPRIPRFRRKQDPRRPLQADDEARSEASETATSYGQWLEPEDEQDDLKQFEDATDEVAREGRDGNGSARKEAAGRNRDDVEAREEFEDLTGEVSREGNDKEDR